MQTSGKRPLISVIMANYAGARFIERALDAVLAQTVTDLEVIVSDDASTDDSAERVAAMQRRDARVQLLAADRNGGPARCRNRALDAARGEWIAIVDSDDLIHPERFERLLAAADQAGVDMIADDLLYFHDDGAPSRLLLPEQQQTSIDITAVDWIRAGEDGSPPLGYLKPLIRASALRNLRYDETLRIGEDYDLVLRLLLSGVSLRVIPEPWYFYRRHDQSISHRLSAETLAAMIDSQQKFMRSISVTDVEIRAALLRRSQRLTLALAFEQLVAALKRRDFAAALKLVVQRPGMMLRLARAAGEHVLPPVQPVASPVPSVVVLSDHTATAAPPGAVHIQVPAYVEPGLQSFGGISRRRVWRQLADLGRSGQSRLVAHGQAGLYAAGFAFGSEAPQLIEQAGVS